MAVAFTGRAAGMDHCEALVTKALGSGVTDPGLCHVRRMGRQATIALLACVSYGQPASHHGQLNLPTRVRRVLVPTLLLGLMRENLASTDALAPG
jgi:hypothetical protein